MKKPGKTVLLFFYLLFSFIICSSACGDPIAIYGDSQHNSKVQRKIVQGILSSKPEIVFRMGDLVNDGNNPKLWDIFNTIHAPLLESTEYFPALGNHEHDSPLYFQNFPFLHNRRWYSVDRLGIHFVILDSNSRLDLESEQYKWLVLDLASADHNLAKFTVVIFHHPFFDVADVHPSDEKKLKSILMPLFKRYGVKVVFSGHSHNYQRYEYEGIAMIVTGGGGANLYPRALDNPYLKQFSYKHHFCLLTPEKSFLRVRVIDTDAQVIDDFKIPARVKQRVKQQEIH